MLEQMPSDARPSLPSEGPLGGCSARYYDMFEAPYSRLAGSGSSLIPRTPTVADTTGCIELGTRTQEPPPFELGSPAFESSNGRSSKLAALSPSLAAVSLRAASPRAIELGAFVHGTKKPARGR